MRDKVLRFIREHGLLRAGDRVGVAVSGGADSIALMLVLRELWTELGLVLSIAHFNHDLRGEQSDADEAFVRDLAHRHELEFFSHREDIRGYAATNKLGLEAAGRTMRYEWFARLAQRERLDAIATAHTSDDQAETVLLKLLRGAGTRGLAGIHPLLQRTTQAGAPLRIVRPLLCASRGEVESYLTASGQGWREDETNLDRRFLRNRVRHELLPLLRRDYNPDICEALIGLAEIARGEDEYWRNLVSQELAARQKEDRLELSGFAELPLALQRRVLKSFAESSGPALDFEHVEKLRLCALGQRRKAELPGDRIAERSDETMKIRRLRPDYY